MIVVGDGAGYRWYAKWDDVKAVAALWHELGERAFDWLMMTNRSA